MDKIFDTKAKELCEKMTVSEAASQLRYDSPAVEWLGVPAYNWWNEGLHGLARSGTATVFPQAVGLAAMFDTGLISRVGDITSTEARAKYNACSRHGDRDIYKGLTIWSPNINIFRDPRWGRGHETYGEDPFLTAECAKAYVGGLQGEGKYLKAAACLKHFAVHSGPEALRHEFNAEVCQKDLTETYLYAFEDVIASMHVEGVMGAYNRVNGEPACASGFLMQRLRDMGFDGYFVSDCWAIRDFHENHRVTSSAVESAAMALKAGCDLNCGCTYVNLLAALEKGLIDESDIRRSCKKLLRTRFRLGLFDKDCEYNNIPYSTVACNYHKQVAYECAVRSMVLLRNDGILPLDKDRVKTLAVIGPNADSTAALEGNYCGRADKYITFLRGIQDGFDGRVLYSEGCHLYRDRISNLAQAGDRYAEALACAENADAVVLCVGLDATIEGEEGDTGNEFSSGDKQSLFLPESQRKLIRLITALRKPVVIVCASGSSVNAEADANKGCDRLALIQAWYSGEQGGKALADILFGRTSPSGKLPVTFYKTADALPDFTDYSMQGRTYRYTRDNILCPFGFGLTYGDIRVTALECKGSTAVVTARNDGEECEDVIELYIQNDSQYSEPFPKLCGFKRIRLARGEEKTFCIDIPDKAYTVVNENGERIKCTSTRLFAGTHQPDSLSCTLSGTECVMI